ncbi:MAG: ATP-binding cassette domain-containing protein [Aggregatilineales bacterium]
MSEVILHVENLRIRPDANPINFSMNRAEIVGLAGLDGHGQEAFLEILCGLRQAVSGQVIAQAPNGAVTIRNSWAAVQAGVVYLPRNRKTQGILPTMSVLDNFSIATMGRSERWGIVNRRAQRQSLAAYRNRLSMVFASPSAAITSLSGGNQQKVLLARWMALNPRLMLLNDPTRGVDLPTRMKLYEIFREMVAQEGTALMLLSTEIEEILQLCDRTLVFREGSIFAELPRASIKMRHIIAAMFGRPYED